MRDGGKTLSWKIACGKRFATLGEASAPVQRSDFARALKS